jgi:hypothetical protein
VDTALASFAQAKKLISESNQIDAMTPYIVNSLDGLGNYSERVSPLGLIVIVDSIQEENNFVELKTQSDEK